MSSLRIHRRPRIINFVMCPLGKHGANKLIVDLMFTKSAEDKHPEVVKAAVATFERFAKDSGYLVSRSPLWQHSIGKSERTQFFFEITTVGDEAIEELVNQVRGIFGTNPLHRNDA